jgi:hypothetical protein
MSWSENEEKAICCKEKEWESGWEVIFIYSGGRDSREPATVDEIVVSPNP